MTEGFNSEGSSRTFDGHDMNHESRLATLEERSKHLATTSQLYEKVNALDGKLSGEISGLDGKLSGKIADLDDKVSKLPSKFLGGITTLIATLAALASIVNVVYTMTR